MIENIDWEEFKEYRLTSTKKQDNFLMMLDFLKSYYKLFSIFDIYNTMVNDEFTKMMLDKRGIIGPDGLEQYLFKKVV